MAFRPQDIERIIMQAHYKQAITQSPACNAPLSDMERADYEKRIAELVGAVESLLDANNNMGEKLNQAVSQITTLQDYVSVLEQKVQDLEGKNAAHNRHRFSKHIEKNSALNTGKPKGKTKEETENDYIESEGKDTDQSAEDEGSEECQEEMQAGPQKRDLSNRPDHYETMHADIFVEHECDLDKLAEMGLEFIRYTRPVDQIDRISAIRQDRYRYAWVRDKEGNEFPIFVAKKDTRKCMFVNESDYDYPRLVPHTSVTSNGLSDFIVNRFQYAISSGREMYRMVNEKLKISQQTLFNWLKRGGEFIEDLLPYVKRKLLVPGTVIYCDESWIDTKVKGPDGQYHYVRRYMWVIVNLTTQMCYYLYGSRKKEVIKEFLKDFAGTLMTDAYAAYTYFSKLPGCTHVCCWAHCRRIYVAALQDYKDKLAKEFIDLIAILYKVEVESILYNRTAEEIIKARKEEAIPILHTLKQKADDLLARDKKKPLYSAKLHHALTYMVNNWNELIGYVNIGNVLIDNNVCERSVRPFTNLRKSFGGFSSEDGARTSAGYLTIIETCKLMKKAPLDFFRSFFNMIIDGRRDYENMSQVLLRC